MQHRYIAALLQGESWRHTPSTERVSPSDLNN